MPWKKILSSKIVLVLALLLLIFGLNVEWKQWKERTSIQKEIDSLTAQQNQYEQKNRTLEDSLKLLSTKDFKDRIAREQLNMKKDGEIVVNFPETLPVTNQQNTTPTAPAKPNWEQWWNYFFKS